MNLKIFRCICRRMIPLLEIMTDILSKYAGKGSKVYINVEGNGDFELYIDDSHTLRMERTHKLSGEATTGIYKGANLLGTEDDE